MISGHLSAPHRIRIRHQKGVKAHRAGGIPPPPQHPHSLGHEKSVMENGGTVVLYHMFGHIFWGCSLKNRPKT